jgi:predicted RNase H-like nuclease (RuvC/YqgF family)
VNRTIGLLVFLIALDADAQMYKCVDERGRTQYTDKPQPGCKESAIKPSAPLSGQVRPPKEDLPREDADLKRRLIEYEASAAKERQERMALAARCAQLRQEMSALANSARIFTQNAQGEREYMDDATREQRVARLQQELRACP